MATAPIVGRAVELAMLHEHSELARRGKPQLVVLYGRRRVGKTFLLRHHGDHLKGVSHCYSPVTREAAADQRQQLLGDLQRSGIDLPADVGASWSSLLDAVVDAATERPISLAIDEAPYLIDSDASWTSALQHSWDRARHLGAACHLMLTLTGSAVSTMTEVVSSGGPLYERPNRLIHLLPFDLPTSSTFLRAPTAQATIEAHAACGGYPLLLSRWDVAATAEDNLIRLAGDPVGALTANASTLLLDMPDVGGHRRVLGAIGRGAHRFGEITNRAGQRAERSLDVLQRSGFVRQRHPLGQPRVRDAHYVVDDIYLRFWFAVIERRLQLIEAGQGATVIRSAKATWTNHVAAVFEQEARNHAARLVRRGLLPEMLIGEWWTDRPDQAQLDVVGTSGSRWLLVGEAKWRDRLAVTDLRRFERNLSIAGSRAAGAALAVWAKSTVTAEVTNLRPGMSVFGPEEMVEP